MKIAKFKGEIRNALLESFCNSKALSLQAGHRVDQSQEFFVPPVEGEFVRDAVREGGTLLLRGMHGMTNGRGQSFWRDVVQIHSALSDDLR